METDKQGQNSLPQKENDEGWQEKRNSRTNFHSFVNFYFYNFFFFCHFLTSTFKTVNNCSWSLTCLTNNNNLDSWKNQLKICKISKIGLWGSETSRSTEKWGVPGGFCIYWRPLPRQSLQGIWPFGLRPFPKTSGQTCHVSGGCCVYLDKTCKQSSEKPSFASPLHYKNPRGRRAAHVSYLWFFHLYFEWEVVLKMMRFSLENEGRITWGEGMVGDQDGSWD